MSQKRVILAERPRYIVPTANCFRVVSAPVSEPGPGEVRVRTEFLSMDVMLYARVKHISLDVAPIDIDCAMVGPAVGTIEASNAAGFPVGTRVSGYWGWEQRAVTGTAVSVRSISAASSRHTASAFTVHPGLPPTLRWRCWLRLRPARPWWSVPRSAGLATSRARSRS